MYFIGMLAITLGILLGCSTTNLNGSHSRSDFRPPEVSTWPVNNILLGEKDFDSVDLYLNRIAKENPGETITWWVDYRRAQLWSDKNKNIACENFSRLAGEANFPIRRLAYLRAHEVCPKENQILTRLEAFDLATFDPWLTKSALDVAILKAERTHDQTQLIELYTKKSKVLTRHEEKIEFSKKALHLARKLKDEKKIRELKNRIYGLSPSQKPSPPPREFLTVASDFRFLRNFDEALRFYKKILKYKHSSHTDKIAALKGIRTTFRIQQKKAEALAATVDLAKFVEKYFNKSKKEKSDAALLADTLQLLARTYWTEGQNKMAQKILDKIVKKTNGKTSLAEVYWMRGRMKEESQNYDEAIQQFQLALKESIESDSFRDKVNWYLAWNLRKTNRLNEAEPIFKDLKKRTTNNYEKSKYTFWLAKTYKQLKEDSDSKSEYKDLIEEDPLGFYGLLAHRELNEPIPIKLLKDDPSPSINSSLHLTNRLDSMIDENYYSWLVATREYQIALGYLDSTASQLRKISQDDTDSWSELFELYALSQNYQGLFAQLNLLEPSVRRSILEKNPTLIFPVPYFDTVNQAAGRFGISPEFIYSIMRQESAFNPDARSNMDAFGLMQLLPQVAKRSAEENSIEYTKPEDLYSPHINIPIGSAHLRELWDKYNGEVILAAASYNASERAILSWLNTRYRSDTLEFIEDIPYDETRDYVKLVLRNLVTYQIISAKEDRFNFPEWTLRISADK